MGRLVAPRVGTGGLEAGTEELQPGTVGFKAGMPSDSRGESPDDYKTRVAKYIPAEIVGFYIAANSLLASSDAASQSWLPIAHIAILALGLIGTPIYLKTQAEPDQPYGTHISISTVAFLLWAYAIPGGVFSHFKLENGLLASLALIVFSFVVGMHQPTKTS